MSSNGGDRLRLCNLSADPAEIAATDSDGGSDYVSLGSERAQWLDTMSIDLFYRYAATIRPEPSRTIPRPFVPGYPEGFGPSDASRAQVVVARILALEECDLAAEVSDISALLDKRHYGVEDMLLRRF